MPSRVWLLDGLFASKRKNGAYIGRIDIREEASGCS
jgi:hypothetical protein